MPTKPKEHWIGHDAIWYEMDISPALCDIRISGKTCGDWVRHTEIYVPEHLIEVSTNALEEQLVAAGYHVVDIEHLNSPDGVTIGRSNKTHYGCIHVTICGFNGNILLKEIKPVIEEWSRYDQVQEIRDDHEFEDIHNVFIALPDDHKLWSEENDEAGDVFELPHMKELLSLIRKHNYWLRNWYNSSSTMDAGIQIATTGIPYQSEFWQGFVR